MIVVKQRPFQYNWTGNSVYYELYSAAAAADETITFEVRVFFRYCNETEFTQIADLPFVPYLGSVKFNLQDVLHAHLQFNMPDLYINDTVVEMTNQSGRFYIDFREITTTNLNPPYDSSEVEYHREIVRGGIHVFRFKGNNYWLSYHPTYLPFFTWQTSGRLAAINERMYLAWYCQDDIGPEDVVARVTVTYNDGSTGTKDVAIVSNLHHVYLIPAGIQELGLNSLDVTKTIWRWEMVVLNITDPMVPISLSQVFKYELDNRNDYNDVVLHYRNSLGGIDSVRVRGVIETNLSYEIIETSGLMESDYFMQDQLPALDSIYKSKETVVFKGDIGHLGKEEQDRLRDAFVSRECYRERLGKWWPVKLLNQNTKLRTSTDKRFTFPIEWQYADAGSDFYTPDIDLGEGEATSNVCLCNVLGLVNSVTFGAGDTIAYVQFQFTVECPEEGENIDKVEYKVNDGAWVELAYPYAVPPEVNHAVDEYGTISVRVKCNDRESGPVSVTPFNTFVEALPAPDPETDNSSITNFTGAVQILTVRINFVTVWQRMMANGQTISFNLPDAYVDANLAVICETLSPTEATVNIDGVIIPADGYPPRRAQWIGLDIPSGLEIIMQ